MSENSPADKRPGPASVTTKPDIDFASDDETPTPPTATPPTTSRLSVGLQAPKSKMAASTPSEQLSDAPLVAANHPNTFEETVLQIINGLTPDLKSSVWEAALKERSSEEWAQDICQYTVPSFKNLLSSRTVPQINDLLDLSWESTKDWGVYGCLLIAPAKDYHYHLYAGSATSENKWKEGLNGRKGVHRSPSVLDTEPNYFHRLMYDDKNRDQHWFTMLRIPPPSSWDDDIKRNHKIVSFLAECVYAIWLGAFKGQGYCHSDLYTLCPFGSYDNLPYRGTCTHSPLTEALRTPQDAKRKQEKKAEYQKEYWPEWWEKTKAKQTPEERTAWLAKRAAQQAEYRRRKKAKQSAEQSAEQAAKQAAEKEKVEANLAALVAKQAEEKRIAWRAKRTAQQAECRKRKKAKQAAEEEETELAGLTTKKAESRKSSKSSTTFKLEHKSQELSDATSTSNLFEHGAKSTPKPLPLAAATSTKFSKRTQQSSTRQFVPSPSSMAKATPSAGMDDSTKKNVPQEWDEPGALSRDRPTQANGNHSDGSLSQAKSSSFNRSMIATPASSAATPSKSNAFEKMMNVSASSEKFPKISPRKAVARRAWGRDGIITRKPSHSPKTPKTADLAEILRRNTPRFSGNMAAVPSEQKTDGRSMDGASIGEKRKADKTEVYTQDCSTTKKAKTPGDKNRIRPYIGETLNVGHVEASSQAPITATVASSAGSHENGAIQVLLDPFALFIDGNADIVIKECLDTWPHLVSLKIRPEEIKEVAQELRASKVTVEYRLFLQFLVYWIEEFRLGTRRNYSASKIMTILRMSTVEVTQPQNNPIANTPRPSIAPARPRSTSSSQSESLPSSFPPARRSVEPEVEPGVPDVLWDERSRHHHVDYWAGMTAFDMRSVIGKNIDPEVFRRNTPGFSGNRKSSTPVIDYEASDSAATTTTPKKGTKRKAEVYEQDSVEKDGVKQD